MTVSINVMSAGAGYQYFMSSVAAGDGDRSMSTPLTRYYTETGTPPGRWTGSGVAALGDDAHRLREGDVVLEEQMAHLVGKGVDPMTGAHLGRAFPVYGVGDGAKRRPVAGYDFTFSVPKAASVLWAVADAGTQQLIVDVHHAAVRDVIDFMERELAATRVGVAAGDGAVAQVDVAGLVGMAFDHYDSRAGDPHLHTHVVISNKVMTVLDGRWRSLDGRPLFAATVALSELHEALFADRLTSALGVQWEARDRGRDRNPVWAITGMPDETLQEFSTRSRRIDERADELIDQYTADHGRRPARNTITKLRARATLETRPAKHVQSLAHLTERWRARASRVLGRDSTQWASDLVSGPPARVFRADDVPLDMVTKIGHAVVTVVGEKRSTWRRWNLYAEAARQTMGWRFATTADREAVLGLITDAAENGSLLLTPPDLAATPVEFQRPDGSSIFRPKASALYSSERLLAAEVRLLERAGTRTAPVVGLSDVERATSRLYDRRALSAEQTGVLAKIALSARQVDLLVGPAGAGKTTAMRALHAAWTSLHGADSVVGLAPSAAAAAVLAEELGIPCENTAKWIHEHAEGRMRFKPGQLVIIDEATLAGTLSLDLITTRAAQAGVKVLLVGDHAQLQSVDAGGVFALLAQARDAEDGVPELTHVHRFTHEWEKTASLDLRHGRVEVIDTYLAHDRARDGHHDQMTDAAYAAWRTDLAAGRRSILVTDNSQTVRDLNERARAERLLTGASDPGRAARLADGTAASAGDLVITRHNDRRLRTRNGAWVRNGDRWTVQRVHRDGSMVVRRDGAAYGASVLLPARYVAEYLDLGYAITAHRAQGVTVDTAHVLVTSTTTRENLYVGLTRGRDANLAYIATDAHTDGPTADDHAEPTAAHVLARVLRTSGIELSATETMRAEQDRYRSIAQLAAEYETIAAEAQRDRWADLVYASDLEPDKVDSIVGSPAFGALTAELRRAEAVGYDVDALLPDAAAGAPLDDAADPAAVLHYRAARLTSGPARNSPWRQAYPQQRLIAGLVPEAQGQMTREMRQALADRAQLIDQRARSLVDHAIRDREPWIVALGVPPDRLGDRHAWTAAAVTVAAYRDRYGITTPRPLGGEVATDSQALDAARAARALQVARTSEPAQRATREYDHGRGHSRPSL
ncbi:relaxase domain-containing protein [Antribacter sp. KLBMP9083]|uniref:Relaxase domain-containing protein n=1 Tax=Antribacter soli TaxID=2910976 RepID=A0AA41QAV0_9MICO|nr:MobF family relaxase [Antribacter soli]MCF4119873.1 relaxase domain-containing protein [Antribacter soli]